MGGLNSSVVRDYDYDADAQVLYITFVGGKTYGYGRVPPDVFDAFWRLSRGANSLTATSATTIAIGR